MEGILHINNFLKDGQTLLPYLLNHINWDERMTARKTASYGVAYNYSQMSYPFQALTPKLEEIIELLIPQIGFEANNCLINYYENGKSKMGFHSDQIDILEPNTGIAIISLGETRELKFRKIEYPEQTLSYFLASGSLIYMSQEIQKVWQHAIPTSNTENVRLSLTFRKLKT